MDELQRRALLRAAVAALVVLLVGGVAVFGVNRLRDTGEPVASPSPTGSAVPSPGDEPSQEAWLAWVPGGIPEGVGPAVTTVPVITQATTATSDIAWLERSVDASSVVVDDPPDPYLIPLDVTGIEPTYASFIPQPERELVENLMPGEAILSETEATLRGLGQGATMTFDTGTELTVVGTLPDALMGGHEVLVTKGTGEDLGVTHERYILFRVRPGAEPDPRNLAAQIEPLLPIDVPYPVVEVRPPGGTRFLRANDRELPPIALKLRFGEFAAIPDPSGDGPLQVDQAWESANITTEDVPILGPLTCHRKAFRPLREAMQVIAAGGDAGLITDRTGCYEPAVVLDDPSGLLTAVDFGAAVELNSRTNRPGNPPEQPDSIVQPMFANGFSWGGRYAWPQGALFRYRKYPPPGG
jgi:hypothetical protein